MGEVKGTISVEEVTGKISVEEVTGKITYSGSYIPPDSPLNLVDSGPCQFWLDGKDEDTISLFEDTDRVIKWDCKGLLAAHVSNAVDARRPTYSAITGRLTFVDANDSYLSSTSITLTQPNTIFILCKITGVTNQFIFDGITARQLLRRNAGVFDIWAGGFASGHVGDVNDDIHVVEFNGAGSIHWLNGVSSGALNPGANNLIDFVIGSNNNRISSIDGEIMEVFGYNCSITDAERIKCENYLIDKWGLPY